MRARDEPAQTQGMPLAADARDAHRRASPRRTVALCVGGLVLFFATAIVHQLHVGSTALIECDAALAQGDSPRAIAEARRAAEAAVPWSPHPERAYARLEIIARDAESRKDDRTATAAWRAMRTAALGTRGLGSSTDARRDQANSGIARVTSTARAAARTDLATTLGEERRILDELERDETPTSRAFLLLGLGSILFFAGIARLATVTSIVGRETRVPSAAALAGIVLVVLGCIGR